MEVLILRNVRYDQSRDAQLLYPDFVPVATSELPEYYRNILPSICECGSDIVVNDNQTRISCCNSSCFLKRSKRLSYFLSSLNFKDFGDAACLKIYKAANEELEFDCFLAAFLLSDDRLSEILGNAEHELFINIREELSTKPFRIEDIIVSLGIPGIGSSSKFFDLSLTPSMLCKAVENGNIEYLLQSVNIYAYDTHMGFLDSSLDITLALSCLCNNVLPTPKNKIPVMITGPVAVDGISLTRSQFISECESLKDSEGNSVYRIIETNSKDKVQFVITDTDEDTAKYRLGKELGLLISATDFYNYLKSELKRAEDE